MAAVKNITIHRVRVVVGDLLGKDVQVDNGEFAPHPATLRGLVNDENVLMGALGADLAFAHGSGAALALLPAGRAADAGNEPEEELLEFYYEVANVASRLINEVAVYRMRIDPGIEHDPTALAAIIDSAPAAGFKVGIKGGYGDGHLGFWLKD